MDKHSYKILKKLYSSGSIPFEQFLALLGCTLENYRDSSAFEAIFEYVKIVKISPGGSDDEDGIPSFILSPIGLSYVEERRSRSIRNILLIVFSGITAAAAVAALFVR